jgi:glycolate oxidase iron-sulfur subunit
MKAAITEQYLASELGRQADDILRGCVHCGFCNATCPTYQLTGDELDGPRGRIYQIKELLEGQPAAASTLLHLDRCLTCRNCETTCPSGVRYGRLADIGREIIEEKTQRPIAEKLKRRVARMIFPYPDRVSALLRLGRHLRWFLPSNLRHQIPPEQELPAPSEQPPTTDRKMIVLGGCVQAAATPATNDAARRVLRRLGIDLVEVPSAGCCGAVSYHLAARDEGLGFMRRNVDAWWPYIDAGAEAIVSTASACGVMIGEYGELLKDDPDYADRASRVSELAKDLSEVVEAEDLSVLRDSTCSRTTAVHCPCTLLHGQKRDGALERILERSGIALVETAEKHLCCGSAGTYSLLQPEISQRLLERKLAALTAGRPEQIVTANIGCQLHLGSQSAVPVKHWIELLDARQGE